MIRMALIKPKGSAARLIGFQTRDESWLPGFVSPIFEVDGHLVIQTSSRTLVEEIKDSGRITPYPTVELRTFCKSYNPKKVRYTAYWDTEKLWVTREGEFTISLHQEDMADIQSKWGKLSPRDRHTVSDAWAKFGGWGRRRD